MISPANASVFQKEWFRFEGTPSLPCAVPKAEYQELLEKYWQEVRKQQAKANGQFMDKVEKAGGSVHLAKDQKQKLGERYDPKNMSWADYQAFIDDLCKYGVLEEGDKKFLRCGSGGSPEIAYVDWSAPMCMGSIEPSSGGGTSFASWKGNALGWAKYLAGFQGWDERSQSWQKTRESILFGKVSGILNALSE